MDERVHSFVEELGKKEAPQSCYNQYFDWKTRQNLKCFLNYSMNRHCEIILIGEAPGHRGCRLTGIPFTSPRVVRTNEAPFFKACRMELDRNGDTDELTARAVWETLQSARRHVLLWNIFPFHPRQPGIEQTNRKPNQDEIVVSIPYVVKILKLFKPIRIVAVGRVAYDNLSTLNPALQFEYLRHPAHGGLSKFQEGFKNLLQTGK